jgi:hypothetical protein
MFDYLLQEKRRDACGNGCDHYTCQCAPVVHKHGYPVLVKTEQQGCKCAPVKRYIKSQCVYLTFPSECPGKQYKMSRAADRKKFGYALHDAENNSLHDFRIQDALQIAMLKTSI